MTATLAVQAIGIALLIAILLLLRPQMKTALFVFFCGAFIVCGALIPGAYVFADRLWR
jgi:uncharacterized membrane protein HdeD (DUF308 family)